MSLLRSFSSQLTMPRVLEAHPSTGIVHAGEEKRKDSNKAKVVVSRS